MGRRSSLHGDFVRVKTSMGLELFDRGGGQKISCFNLAENRAANSLWVGAQRYERISCASKLL